MGIDTTKVTQEITNKDKAGRDDAIHLLGSATLAEIQAVSTAIKGHVSGLDGFHLDTAHPTTVIHYDKTATQPAQDFPVLKFVNDKDPSKSAAMFDDGSAFTLDGQATQLRTSDIAAAAAPAAPTDAAAPPAAPAAPTDAAAPPAAPAAPTDAAAPPAAPAAPTDAAAPPAAPTDAAAPPAAPTDAAAAANEAKVKQYIQAQVDEAALSAPVKKGEGYYQVLRRMNPTWTPQQTAQEAHRIKKIDNNNECLKVGERLPLMTPEQKAAAVTQAMAGYDAATPSDKAAMLAKAQAAFPDAPPAAPAAPTDAAAPPAAPAAPTDAAAPPAAPAAPTDAAAPPAAPAAPTDAAAPPAAPAAPTDAAAPPAAPAAPTDAAAPPATTAFVPMANIKDTSLNPVLIDPKGDKNDPANKAYNPLAPLGLADGTPGANVTQTTAGVENRAVTSSKPNTDEINGKIDGTWNWNHWYNTDFKTDDTFKDGKLDTRTTTYDTDRVNMKFQTNDPTKPVLINGVKTVASHFDPTTNGYSTQVTDSNGKTYTFQTDSTGTKVTDYQHS